MFFVLHTGAPYSNQPNDYKVPTHRRFAPTTIAPEDM